MEKTAGKLADILVAKGIVELRDRDFYRYAIEGILLYFVNLLTIFILAVINGKLVECCIFLSLFFPLRTYCGGMHMKTWYSCYVVSCVLIQSILILSGMIHMGWVVLLAGLVLSEICIWKLAPCESSAHILELSDNKKCRRKARMYSIFVFCLAVLLKCLEADICATLCFCAESLCSVLLLAGYFLKGK